MRSSRFRSRPTSDRDVASGRSGDDGPCPRGQRAQTGRVGLVGVVAVGGRVGEGEEGLLQAGCAQRELVRFGCRRRRGCWPRRARTGARRWWWPRSVAGPGRAGRRTRRDRRAVVAASRWSVSTATSRICPPIWRRRASTVSSAITSPSSSTIARSASRSISSRFWLVTSTPVPPSAMSAMRSHSSSRLRGSRPVVGSSSSSSDGSPINVAPRSSRRRIPPEYVPTRRSAASASPSESSSAALRARQSSSPMP